MNLSMGDTSPSLEEGISLPEEVTYELLEGGTLPVLLTAVSPVPGRRPGAEQLSVFAE